MAKLAVMMKNVVTWKHHDPHKNAHASVGREMEIAIPSESHLVFNRSSSGQVHLVQDRQVTRPSNRVQSNSDHCEDCPTNAGVILVHGEAGVVVFFGDFSFSASV